MSISDRYLRLQNRRIPSQERGLYKAAGAVDEAYAAQQGEYTKYLLGAMAQVGKTYTIRLIEQGDRVASQLSNRLEGAYSDLDFCKQGSVTNNTHIKYSSDVDVLVIIDKFVSLEPPQKATNPYKGNAEEDLFSLRLCCLKELKIAFPAVKIDNEGSTAIQLSGGSLYCDVDVVPANWYNTTSYVNGEGDHTRGVMVLNKDTMKRNNNYPFLFNYRLENFDNSHFGIPRMLIRLLKSVKADYEEENSKVIDFSSFDICSLVYRMPSNYFAVSVSRPLHIIYNYLKWIELVLSNDSVRNDLKSIDDSRLIFDKAGKEAQLKLLLDQLNSDYQTAIMEQGGYLFESLAHLK